MTPIPPNSRLAPDQIAVEVVAAAFRPAGFAQRCDEKSARLKAAATKPSLPALERAQQAAPLRGIATAMRSGEESGSKLPHSTELRRGFIWSAAACRRFRGRSRGEIESNMPGVRAGSLRGARAGSAPGMRAGSYARWNRASNDQILPALERAQHAAPLQRKSEGGIGADLCLRLDEIAAEVVAAAFRPAGFAQRYDEKSARLKAAATKPSAPGVRAESGPTYAYG